MRLRTCRYLANHPVNCTLIVVEVLARSPSGWIASCSDGVFTWRKNRIPQ